MLTLWADGNALWWDRGEEEYDDVEKKYDAHECKTKHGEKGKEVGFRVRVRILQQVPSRLKKLKWCMGERMTMERNPRPQQGSGLGSGTPVSVVIQGHDSSCEASIINRKIHDSPRACDIR